MKRIRWDGNEIILTDDMENSQIYNVQNFDDALGLIGATTIMNGLTVTQAVTPDMTVLIPLGIAYDLAVENLLVSNDQIVGTIPAADPTQARRDIIEIKRLENPTALASRQFKNPSTGVVTTSAINTEVEYNIEVKVLSGTPGGSAPSVETGYMKIAEILVPAASTTVIDANIYNCDADQVGATNTNWTTDTNTTYRNGSISDMNTYVKTLIDQGVNTTDSPTFIGIEATTASIGKINSETINMKNPNVFAQIGSDLNISGITVPTIAALSSTDIAFIDGTNDNLRVYRFNYTTLTWSQVGSGLPVTGASNPSITALSSTDIAFIDVGNNDLRVYRFNGSTWSQIGSDLNISGMGVPRLTALSSTDIAFIDFPNNDLRVYRFNGSTWSQIGSDLNIPGMDTPSITALSSIDIAFIDAGNNDLRTYRFNYTTSTWSQIGSDLNISGMGVPTIAALSSTDIAFMDGTNDNLRVYRFNESTWSQVGSDLNILGAGLPSITALSSTDIAFIDDTNEDLRTYRLGFDPFPPSPVFN